MEFPTLGSQCGCKDCKQLDFLPFTCSFCSAIFCKEHFPAQSHNCPNFKDNVSSGTEKTATFPCSDESCKNGTLVEMKCVKCEKNFCLSHRYHGCLEMDETEKARELKKWTAPKEEFMEAKNVVDQEITKKLRKSKNSAMANKVQLMKLKGKAIGCKGIPTTDRLYFQVHLPTSLAAKSTEKTKAVFVSNTWSIGKIIDSIADLSKIPNSNNVANAQKLRLFYFDTGEIVTKDRKSVV